jgi:hypothetical protein
VDHSTYCRIGFASDGCVPFCGRFVFAVGVTDACLLCCCIGSGLGKIMTYNLRMDCLLGGLGSLHLLAQDIVSSVLRYRLLIILPDSLVYPGGRRSFSTY